jgi:cytochrome subunit of sulfide dehydrogenase
MKLALFLAGVAVAMPFSAVAQDSAPARSLAASCAACHGTDGRSATKEVAAIAGLPKEHIASQMRAFRDGTRPATVMHQIAKGYSDQQIDSMADYFSRRPR